MQGQRWLQHGNTHVSHSDGPGTYLYVRVTGKIMQAGASPSYLVTPGTRISICRHPSSRASKARIRKGTVLPKNWKRNAPNGGPIRTPRASPLRATPIAFPLSLLSVYRSANMPIPARNLKLYLKYLLHIKCHPTGNA